MQVDLNTEHYIVKLAIYWFQMAFLQGSMCYFIFCIDYKLLLNLLTVLKIYWLSYVHMPQYNCARYPFLVSKLITIVSNCAKLI